MEKSIVIYKMDEFSVNLRKRRAWVRIKGYRKQIVAALDIMITVAVSLFLYTVFKPFAGMSGKGLWDELPSLVIFLVCMLLTQLLLQTYKSLWRYADGREYILLFLGVAIAYLCYLVADTFIIKSGIPIYITLSSVSVSFVLMLLMRFCYRSYRRDKRTVNNNEKKNVVIVGAGSAGINLMEEFSHSDNLSRKTYCFFDDDVAKIGKTIHGIQVKGNIESLPQSLLGEEIHEIIVAIPSMTANDKRRILSICQAVECRVKILPDYVAFLNSNKLSKNMRNVQIEDLLGRSEVSFDGDEAREFLSEKVVMVTGGGGSIGSELCRQVARANPEMLVILDIYENNAYDIQNELICEYADKLNLRVEIASVRDGERVNYLFDKYRPQIVIHAAAHKHVPFMEDCPGEAIKNNVMGTYNVVHAADRFRVEKFVLVSTDKAVNPTNAMGASKRLCEMVLESMQMVSKTTYVAVRFGNVLGSNGSVIPLFKRQIEQGGPIRITDKRIIRYFMTIPEAAQLVLQAGAMAEKSEIYVLDMGEPVKILDLAQNLIKLSGYKPYEEIAIEEIGLRPGEKLYEELLMDSDKLKKTVNKKIFIEKQTHITPNQIDKKLTILSEAISTNSNEQIIIALKKAVPTYKSPQEVNSKAFLVDTSQGFEDMAKDEAVALN